MTAEVIKAAKVIASRGYHVVPIRHKMKRPEDNNFLQFRIQRDEVERYFDPNREWNIGVILGTEIHSGQFMAAIDIDLDDDMLIQRVKTAIPEDPIAKRGKKGLTLFVRTGHAIKSATMSRKDPLSGKRFTVIDLLGAGKQTVIPPSIHPETGLPYVWLTDATLENTSIEDLPLIDEWCVHEIRLAVEKPDSPWFLINDMAWNGPGRGGTVDDSLLRSSGAMVEAGAPDDWIYGRIRRAVDACLHVHGLQGWDDGVYDRRIRSMVEDARKKGFETVKKVNPAVARADWLIAVLGGLDHLRRQPGGNILRYADGYWRPQRPEPLETRLINEFAIPHKEMMEALKTARSKLEVWPDITIPKVRLLNGTFDLLSGTFTEAGNPKDYILYQLPIEYDPAALCPTYDEFILRAFKQSPDEDDDRTEEQLEEDARISVQAFNEFFGLTLVPDLSFQTALIIVGETGTGKSTMVNLMHALHSPDAVSATTIDMLNDERARTALVGKLVNVSPEVSSLSRMADNMFKAITGGDRVPVRELYKEQTLAVLQARIVVVGNENFRYSDDSGAIERRLLYLNCGETIPEEERDPDLFDRLKEELPGIFNRVTAAYLTLKSRGKFNKPGAHRRKMEALAFENNQVLQFMQDQTHEGLRMQNPEYKFESNGAIMSTEVYLRYAEWARANGHKQMNNVTFGTKLTRAGFPVSIRWVGGRPVRCREINFLNDFKKDY